MVAEAQAGSLPTPECRRIGFLYLGRRGALARFTIDLAAAAQGVPDLKPVFVISRQNEQLAEISRITQHVIAVNTFASGHGAITAAWQIPALARSLAARLKAERVDLAITLLSHVWTPLVVPHLRSAGIAHATIIHDWAPHPGDPTALVNRWLYRHVPHDDCVITLSSSVAKEISGRGALRDVPIHDLFHPVLQHGASAVRDRPAFAHPFKLLFLGRILAYKGLGLLIDAIELARQRGADIELSVYGEGPLGREAQRLASIGANVVNRWLNDDEIAMALGRHHAVVLSHIEASQSGVAGAAFGAGAPVIATPVGGLAEQVCDGVNGLIAQRCDAAAFADALVRLACDPDLYAKLTAGAAQTAASHSMRQFLRQLMRVTEGARRR